MTAIINFKADKKIKSEAQKIAETMGLTLSDILNIYLRGFVNKKELYISLQEDESNPSDEFLHKIKEARERFKIGKTKRFKNNKEIGAYLKQI